MMIWNSTLTYFNNHNRSGKMLNEAFKSKSSIPMQRHVLYQSKQLQTPAGSAVAGSRAHFPQSDAKSKPCWDVLTNRLCYWLSSPYALLALNSYAMYDSKQRAVLSLLRANC